MANAAPSLAGMAGSQTYAENDVNATPQLIDSDVTFADAEGNFKVIEVGSGDQTINFDLKAPMPE